MDNKKKNTQQERRTYTVADIAAILDISRSTAYRLVREDNFATVHIGNTIRISRKSFEDWLKMKKKEIINSNYDRKSL